MVCGKVNQDEGRGSNNECWGTALLKARGARFGVMLVRRSCSKPDTAIKRLEMVVYHGAWHEEGRVWLLDIVPGCAHRSLPQGTIPCREILTRCTTSST